jgi:tetratricopeptide (TPR) repeat protein
VGVYTPLFFLWFGKRGRYPWLWSVQKTSRFWTKMMVKCRRGEAGCGRLPEIDKGEFTLMRPKVAAIGMLALALSLMGLLPTVCWGTSTVDLLSPPSSPGPLPGTLDLDLPPDPKLAPALQDANAGKLAQALIKVKEVLKQNPKSAPAQELLGAILALQGEAGAGLKALQEAVRLNPQQGTALTKIGDVYLAQGKPGEAKAQFLKAIKANPDYARAYQRLGLLLEKEGNIPGAIESFEKGLVGTPPTYAGVKINLARLYNLTRQFDKTVKLLANQIPPGPQGFLLHIFLSAAYLGQKQSGLAQAEFDRAHTLAQADSARAYLVLGTACREAGLYEDSRKALQQAIQLQPKQAGGYWQLGETLAALKEPDAALQQFQQAVQLAPENRSFKERLASFFLEQKKFPEAIAAYQELLQARDAGPKDYDAFGFSLPGGWPI